MASGAVEEVADVIETVGEETLDAAETVRHLTGRDLKFVFLGSCIGVASGFLIGRRWMERNMMARVTDIIEKEVEELRSYYKQKVAAVDEREEKKPINQVVEDLGYSKSSDDPVAYDKVSEKPELTVVKEEARDTSNIFTNPQPEIATPEWDYKREVKSRADKDIFIIHRDEYMENAWEFDTISLTYFEGDDVLSNERDEVIADQDGTVGLENLSKFGHGSNDPNVVYVCNKEKAVLIEITHSDGSYATEVHGFTEDEIQHSSVRRRPPRRSRFDDSD